MIKILLMFVILIFTNCEARIAFIHIPKTGGITICSLLRKNFNQNDIYPISSLSHPYSFAINSECVMNEVLQKNPVIDHKLIQGHFPFWFIQKKDPDFDTTFLFTVLRDPVKRIISEDTYLSLCAEKQGRSRESNPLNIIPNMLCKCLCSDITLEGEELLADCIRNLERIDYIIFMDDFDKGIHDLFDRLELNLPKHITPLNVTNRSSLPQTDDMIAKIKEINYLDIQLYEYAKTHLRYKHTSN